MRSTIFQCILAVAFGISVCACSNEPPTPKTTSQTTNKVADGSNKTTTTSNKNEKPKPPIKLQFAKEGKNLLLSVDSRPLRIGTQYAALEPDMTAKLHFVATDEGATLKISNKTHTLKKGVNEITVDITPSLLATLAYQRFDRLQKEMGLIKMPISMRGPNDTEELQTDLLFGLKFSLSVWAQRVKNGPLLLPGETPKADAKGVISITTEGIANWALSPAGTFADARLIAITSTEDHGTKDCGTYTNSQTNATRKLSVKGFAHSVEVYDRFSGKRVASKTFKPSMECPKNFKTGESVANAYPDWEPQKAWLQDLSDKL